MRKLKSGYKDRSARDADIDGIVFKVKPMSSEIMTTFAMYTNGMRDKLLSLGEKKNSSRLTLLAGVKCILKMVRKSNTLTSLLWNT